MNRCAVRYGRVTYRDLQRDFVYQGVRILVGRQHREVFGPVAYR
jgi:hypothetical protein